MELEDFVRKVLTDLNNAVDGARTATSRDLYFNTSNDSPTVQFDIAVSAEDVSGMSGKAGVKVLSFAEGGGEISKTNKNSTVSRVKFGVQIKTLTKAEEEEYLKNKPSPRSGGSTMFKLDKRY